VSLSNEVAQLCASSPAEGLAWNTPGDEFDVVNAPAVEVLEQVGWITEVTDPSESPDVRGVRFDRPCVDVGAGDNGEARVLQSEAEAAGAAEEIECAWTRLTMDPLTRRGEVPRVRGVSAA
jgi:hypothetical protein